MKGKKISFAFLPFSLTSPSSLLKFPIDYGLKTANRCIYLACFDAYFVHQ